MSLLGKLLAVLNVLAAVGFFAMAGYDWQKKQEWADTLQQSEIVVNGLPVDSADKDREGHPRSQNLRNGALNQLFQKSGGNPVKTQQDEVDRVRNALQAQIDGAGDKKAQELNKVLYFLATTEDQRDRFAAALVTPNPNPNVEELQKQFNDAFDWVKQVPAVNVTDSYKKPQQAELPLDVKRQRIAGLLFRLTPVLMQQEENAAQLDLLASRAYNRFLAVVGLSAAVRAVDERALVLQTFYDNVDARITRDRNSFLAAQRSLLEQIKDLQGKVEVQKLFLKEQSDLAAREKSLTAARQETLTKLQTDLADAQAATKKALDRQAEMEQKLFTSRKDFRNAFRKNEELEKQIRELEKGR